MESLQDICERINRKLEEGSALRRASILQEITAVGSVAAAVSKTFPRVAPLITKTLTEDEAVTLWPSWESAEDVLRRCDGCAGRSILDNRDRLPRLDACRKPNVSPDGTVSWHTCPVQESYRHKVLCERLLGEAKIPPRFARRTLGTFKPRDKDSRAALKAAQSFISDWGRPDLQGLLIVGKNGTGKTHLAVAIMHELIKKGVAARFYSSVEFLELAKEGFKNETTRQTIEALAAIPLLVLDDLGKEFIKRSAASIDITDTWANEVFYSLINARYEQDKPLILTTNLLDTEIAARYGASVWSRLAEMCKPVVLDGTDYRMEVAR
jgi:DNA replication protein DnaC